MTSRIFIYLLIIFQFKLAIAQEPEPIHFDNFIKNAISLSEQALYQAEFEEALHFVEGSYFEQFSEYEDKHQILLTIQRIRVQFFQARLHQTPYNSDEHLSHLLGLLPQVEKMQDDLPKGKFLTLLSGLNRSKNLDLCEQYEAQALKIFQEQADYKSLAELKATQISRELDVYFRDENKEAAIALIPKFREEIEYSSKHSKYAQAYNTRHLANIYRIYDIDQEEALKLYEQSLALREAIGFKPFIPASHYSLGEVYSNLNKYDLAIKAYTKSIELAEEIRFIRYTILPNIKLGDIYVASGNEAKAKAFYIKAMQAASKNRYTEDGVGQIIDKIIALEKD